jgi:hypothetical protein
MCSFSHLNSASLTSLRSGFRNCFILDPFCSKVQIILVPFSQFVWNRRSYETKFPTYVIFPFKFFYWVYHLPFSSTFVSFLLFVTQAMLSLFQSRAHCRIRYVRRKFNALSELPLQLSFYRPGIYVAA